MLNVIGIGFGLVELKREWVESRLDCIKNTDYFSDIWNYFDFIGIFTQIGNLSLDFVLTFGTVSPSLKILNSFFAVSAIFFQVIANIKYMRVSDKFSTLI